MSPILIALALCTQGQSVPTLLVEPKQEEKKYAKFWVCETVDDDWKPVGPAKGDDKKKVYEWPAGKKFNLLVINSPTPFDTLFLGIVIHKQGEDGKDIAFVDEYQTEQLEEKVTTKWCTVEGLPNRQSLEAGRYSIYAISWYDRQPTERVGNFEKYFAKLTLNVK